MIALTDYQCLPDRLGADEQEIEMNAAERFARWVNIPSNHNAVLIGLAIAGVFVLWISGDYSPIEAVRSGF